LTPIDSLFPTTSAGLFALCGRVAVVTGGLGVMGRQLSAGLLDAGAEVVIADIDALGSRRFAEQLAWLGQGRVFGCGVDVTRGESLQALRDEVLRRSGHLDILINCAASNDRVDEESGAELSRFESYPLAVWERALEVNLTGTFLACQVLGTEMARRRSGSIINIAATEGLPAPDLRLCRRPDGTQRPWRSAAYPAARGGVIAFSRFLAGYWAEAGVRVNVISPGAVEHHPNELRGAAVYLASDASSSVTGANLVVDGGRTAW
jgi:NAD(P)-dependent dehydrogenase (short-subunit alcohol dehydrogenase family)